MLKNFRPLLLCLAPVFLIPSLALAQGQPEAAGSWASTAPLSVPVVGSHIAALLKDGRVLVAGGRGAGGSSRAAAVFDPVSGRWKAVESMLQAAEAATASTLPSGKVLVAGGVITGPSGINYLASAELFDPSSGTWSAAQPMSSPRSAHTATTLKDGRVLVAGGVTGGHDPLLKTSEIFDPRSGRWSSAAQMPQGRAEATATLTSNGSVVAAGGRGPAHGASLRDIVVFDPAKSEWTAVPHLMSVPRGLHTATLLPDGRVLIAGGTQLFSGNRWDDALSGAEIFDPGTQGLTAAGDMLQRRYYHSAVALPGGRVLVAGGYGSEAGSGLAVDPMTTTEIFDAATLKWRHGPALDNPAGASTPGPSTATLLSVRPCGQNCGKVLLVGSATGLTAQLYTPPALPQATQVPHAAQGTDSARPRVGKPVLIAASAAAGVLIVLIAFALSRRRR